MQRKPQRIWIEAALALILFVAGMLLPAMNNTNMETEISHDDHTPIGKKQAVNMSRSFIEGFLQDEHADLFETNVILQTDPYLSAYLNKNHWVEDYNRTYADRYPLQYYEVEWKNLSTGDIYYVLVHYTKHEIIGWNFFEDRDRLSEEETLQSQIQNVMTKQGYRIDDFWLLHPDSSTYLFKSKEKPFQEADLMIEIKTNETVVTGFHAQIVPPEAFVTWFDKELLQKDLISLLLLPLTLFMGIAAVVTTIMYRKHIPFRRGILFTLIVLVLYLLDAYNSFPTLLSNYPEDPQRFSKSFSIALINAIFTIFMVITVYFSLISGVGMFKTMGKKYWLTWNDQQYDKHILSSMGRGYIYAIMIIGLQNLIFFGADLSFDVWYYDDARFYTENYVYPFLFPLGAWTAAIVEEATYRLFGIAFFHKLLRSKIAAIIVPNFIWSVGHMGYPFFPSYTRVIEVFIIGFVFTFIFLKYGFICAVFTHATLDSLLMGISLLSSVESVNALFTLLYILSPLLVALLIVQAYQRFRNKNAIV